MRRAVRIFCPRVYSNYDRSTRRHTACGRDEQVIPARELTRSWWIKPSDVDGLPFGLKVLGQADAGALLRCGGRLSVVDPKTSRMVTASPRQGKCNSAV